MQLPTIRLPFSMTGVEILTTSSRTADASSSGSANCCPAKFSSTSSYQSGFHPANFSPIWSLMQTSTWPILSQSDPREKKVRACGGKGKAKISGDEQPDQQAACFKRPDLFVRHLQDRQQVYEKMRILELRLPTMRLHSSSTTIH